MAAVVQTATPLTPVAAQATRARAVVAIPVPAHLELEAMQRAERATEALASRTLTKRSPS